ncbi:hypothetical protein RHD99_11050 [Buttiauxella selenatireducens]|uniref:DUF6966 domain-containing protein n=1 Tax=Buttiauxella selenatireducens TaxID=3073902 RepID=A0ABY9SG06_9ENTR|nr:hypothetical protein [Buttiauxella sp. R73]WMY76420.1 hypothetical protein RHD99_11050 [Buttiauxella sp. R73]
MKTNIQHLLTKISLLLSNNDEERWAAAFEQLSKKLDLDYDTALSDIKHTFGGAGSFNDLVLHHKGQMLVRENNELNALQDQLYEAVTTEIINRRNR